MKKSIIEIVIIGLCIINFIPITYAKTEEDYGIPSSNNGWEYYEGTPRQDDPPDANMVKIWNLDIEWEGGVKFQYKEEVCLYDNEIEIGGHPVRQNYITLQWLQGGKSYYAEYAWLSPRIFNDTNGDGILTRFYTFNDPPENISLNQIEYPDDCYINMNRYYRGDPICSEPIEKYNAEYNSTEVYFNITYPEADSMLGLDEIEAGGETVKRIINNKYGHANWTVCYGFHLINLNDTFVMKTDLIMNITDLYLEGFSQYDSTWVEMQTFFAIDDVKYDQSSVSGKSVSYKVSDLELGSFSLGDYYDYNSNGNQVDNQLVNASVSLTFDRPGNRQPYRPILNINFEIPYENNTLIIYDPKVEIKKGGTSSLLYIIIPVSVVGALFIVFIVKKKKDKTKE